MSGDPRTLTLSLISHTNVGKTTLARTLLRHDVGEVMDQPHVTDQSEIFVLLSSDAGRIMLWDTPGFGDSTRLLRRLVAQRNPLGWLLAQVWDRFADRPLWCSQQAVRNARDEADVILYLVNASEDPAAAGYVDAEMEILAWIGRPVMVLLNQTGRPRSAAERQTDEERWRAHLGGRAAVRDVVDLDAFTRCWVQEGHLLERIRAVLPPGRQNLMDLLIERWRAENEGVLRASVARLAEMLEGAAGDREPLAAGLGRGRERRRALEALAQRLRRSIKAATDRLIELHGLDGEAAAEIRVRLEDVSAPGERPEPWKAGVLGGIAGGALGGLAADIATGGLTFGGGTVLGAILGAMGLGSLAWGYQTIGSPGEPAVTWSDEFLARQARDGLLRYLAVAHFGRGAGAYRERPEPEVWRDAVDRVLDTRRGALEEAWRTARTAGPASSRAEARLRIAALLEASTRDVLLELYPVAARLISPAR